MAKTELGQDLSSAAANSVYLLKTENDTIVGILSLQQGGDPNRHITDLQEHLHEIRDVVGIIGEGDPNSKVYLNTNYISNGESRKVSIEKLDAQVKLNTDGLEGLGALLTALVESKGQPLGLAPLDINGWIPLEFLSNGMQTLKGNWDADTNITEVENLTLFNSTYAAFSGAVIDVIGSVELLANERGVEGNNITLLGDGIEDLNSLVLAWNTANPLNSVTLNSANGADIPDPTQIMNLSGAIQVGKKASFSGAIIDVTGSVELEADELGFKGNEIVLINDGSDLDTLVLAWNTDNPLNTVTLNSANGADIPAEPMQLAGASQVGKEGWTFRCSVAGTVDFGNGNITFNINDRAVLNSYGLFEKWDVSDEVTSVFGRVGDISAQNGDYSADQITETNTRKFAIRHNRDASTDPLATDDINSFYTVGSKWFNKVTEKEYILQDSSAGAARWVSLEDNSLALTPTVAEFNKAQYAEFTLPINMDVLTATAWAKLDKDDPYQEIFCTDCVNWSNVFQVFLDNTTYDGRVTSKGYINVWHQFNGDVITIPFENDGNWHHYAAVYNASLGVNSYMELFLDGVSMGRVTLSAPQTITNAMPFSIGLDPAQAYGYEMNGKVANFELWHDALDAKDAKNLYEAEYYQNPEKIVSKTLVTHFLIGDNPLDTTVLFNDSKGTANAVVSAATTYNTVDIPIIAASPIAPKETGLVPTATVFGGTGWTQIATSTLGVNTDTFAMSMWVKPDSANNTQGLFSLDLEGIELWIAYSSGNYAAYYGSSAGATSTPASLDEYHHLVISYNKINPLNPTQGRLEIWVDGVYGGINDITGAASLTAAMITQIGNGEKGFGGWAMVGKMANVEIWSDELDTADALALYNAGYYQNPEDLVAKTLVSHYLMGDNPKDTTALLKDNKGTNDAIWAGGATSKDSRDLPLPTPIILDTDGVPEGVNNLYTQVDTKANLDALPRKEGKFYYASDEDKAYADDGVTLNEIGSGGGGVIETPLLFDQPDISFGIFDGLQTLLDTIGNSFRYSDGNYFLDGVEITLRTFGSGSNPTGDMVVDITNLANNITYATSDPVNMSVLTGVVDWYKFPFSTKFEGVSGQQYRWVLRSLAGAVLDTNNWVVSACGTQANTLYTDGQMYINESPQSNYDWGFKMYGEDIAANTLLSNLTSPTAVNADLYPDVDNFRNIGDPTGFKWLRGYFKALVQVGSSTADSVGLQEGFNSPSNILSNGIRSLSLTKILSIFTTDRLTTVDSQLITVETGNTADGDSGKIDIRTGVPTGTGARGEITLKTAANKAKLEVQPTGADILAIATTKYVDDSAGVPATSILDTVVIEDDFKYVFTENLTVQVNLYKSLIWDYTRLTNGSLSCTYGDSPTEGLVFENSINGTQNLRALTAFDFKTNKKFSYATRFSFEEIPDAFGLKAFYYMGLEVGGGLDSMLFKYSYQDSLEFQVISKQGGVTTQTATGVIPVINTWYDLRIEYDGVNTATYYIDNVLVATVSAGIVNNIYDMFFKVEDTGGVAVGFSHIDYVSLKYDRT